MKKLTAKCRQPSLGAACILIISYLNCVAASPTACPVLTNETADYSLCTGDNSSDLVVQVATNAVDIQFVYFTTPQTGTAMYTGGTLLGTAIFSGVNAPFTATLDNISLPVNNTTAPISYFIYAIIDLNDPDADAGCRPFREIIVRINPTPTVSALPVSQTVCAGTQVGAVIFTGTVPGTVFRWTNSSTAIGLGASGTSNTPNFTATNSTAATINATLTVTPEFTSGGRTCFGDPQSVGITVVPRPSIFSVTGGGSYCVGGQGLFIGLSGSQPGVNYQLKYNGANIGTSLPGTGSALTFGLQTGVGTYTVEALNTPCAQAMGNSVSIATFNCAITISEACICKNNATTLDNGQFEETIRVSAPDGQTWTLTDVKGLFSPLSAAPPAAPSSFSAGTTLTPLGNNFYELKGVHVDAQGYTLSVANGAGTSLSIPLTTCFYPDLALDAIGGPFCLNSPNVLLSASVANNPAANNANPPKFLVNGTTIVPATFNASAGKWQGFFDVTALGSYQVEFVFDAGPAAANTPNNPGCIYSIGGRSFEVINTPATVVCNDLTQVSLDEDCATPVLPDMVLEGGNYGCYDDYTVTIRANNGLSMGSIATGGMRGDTFKVEVKHSISGNSCWGRIVIEDKLAPIASCKDLFLPCVLSNFDPSYLRNELLVLDAYPTATDNCGIPTRTFIDNPMLDLPCGSLINGHEVSAYFVRKWTYADASGNQTTCEQNIYLERKKITDIIKPNGVTLSCTGSLTIIPAQQPHIVDGVPMPYINFNGVPIPLWPNVGMCELSLSYTDDTLFICTGTRTINRKWTFLDWCQPTEPDVNPFFYTQEIKKVDNAGPQLTCPTNRAVSTDNGGNSCCSTASLPSIIMTDDCSEIKEISAMIVVKDATAQSTVIGMHMVIGEIKLVRVQPWAEPDTVGVFGRNPCIPLGTHDVTYTITDDCGNRRVCNFKLIVRDSTPPIAVCKRDYKVSLGIDGTATVAPTVFDDGSFDNCCLSSFSASPSTFSCSNVNQNVTVTLTVTDCAGNTNQCMLTAVPQDKLPPSCIAPPHVTVSCANFDPTLTQYSRATVTDNCCLDNSKTYLGQRGLTHTADYTLFDATCNIGTIQRTFASYDCRNNNAVCKQRIVVTYEENYYVRFPDDRILTTCDGSGQYGEPLVFGEDCELLAVSFEDDTFTVVPDACFKIERHWKIINWCTFDPNCELTHIPNPNPNVTTNHSTNLPGPVVSDRCNAPSTDPWRATRVKINPSDAIETNYCDFWRKPAACQQGSPAFNGYKYTQIIKIADQQQPQPRLDYPDTCDLTDNDPFFWNVDYWWDATHARHDLCEMPIDLKLTATDACSGPNINFRYLLFLDLDGNGSMETVVSSAQLPPVNTVFYGNTGLPNYQGGAARAFDHRNVVNPALDHYRFALQVARSGASATGSVRFNTVRAPNTFVLPQLPHGKHKIKWIIEDGCGNETVYEYTFEIADCKKPTLVCKPLSVNIMQTGMVALWASDFLEYAFDNCTPAEQLKIAVSKGEPAPAEFPRDPATRLPITQVNFTCDDLGPNVIQLWAEDAKGNADFCQVVLLVQDNMAICESKASVAGVLKTETADGVEESNVLLSGNHPAFPPLHQYRLSDEVGKYVFSNAVPIAANFTLTPEKTDNPINGVTTLDLALISKHILGVEMLSSPYKLIAADANRSGGVTTFDVVELRKLVLGIYEELPNNTSWRFVDKSFVFPNPSNPFQTAFPESKTVQEVQANHLNEQFVGIKVGDVNGTALANNLMKGDDRGAAALLLEVEDRSVLPGEVFEVDIATVASITAYQFTLHYLGLELLDILPSTAGMSMDHFAVFADKQLLTTAYHSEVPAVGKFALRFRAVAAAQLSQMLRISDQVTKAVAYRMQAGEPVESLSVDLRFDKIVVGSTDQQPGFEVFQNQPNPFSDGTSIRFYLPRAATATLQVYDETGKMLYRTTGAFGNGHQAFIVDKASLPDISGVLSYEVIVAGEQKTRKMLKI